MTIALVATLLILIVGWGGSMIGLQGVLGALPLAALAVFIVGFVWRVVYWAKSPVPFAIPTVAVSSVLWTGSSPRGWTLLGPPPRWSGAWRWKC